MITNRQVQITGSDLDGSSGTPNRTYQLPETILVEGYTFVYADRQFLYENTDFTESDGEITFLVPVWNDQDIDIRYSI